jgi:hypothetical protein
MLIKNGDISTHKLSLAQRKKSRHTPSMRIQLSNPVDYNQRR